jgi:RNA polymerase sigma-70 factor (ECF subfamily)
MSEANGELPTNEELLSRAISGHRDSFAALANQRRGYLKILANHNMPQGGSCDASDVVQEALLSAWKGLKKLRGDTEGEFWAWLHRIVVNAAKKAARRHRKSEPLPAGSSGQVWLPTNFPSPSQDAIAHEEKAGGMTRNNELASAIDKLCDVYQTVIQLRVFQGMKYDAIAKHMDRSQVAVRQLWHRALKALRKELGDDL